METEEVNLGTEPIDDNALMGINTLETSTEEVSVDDKKKEVETTEEKVSPEGKSSSEKNDNSETIDEYFSALKELYGEGFELPEIITKGVNEKGEKLTPKDKLGILRNTLLDGTQFGGTEEDDRFIRKYMFQSAQEGFDRKKFFQEIQQEQSILELPARELLFAIKKDELGISETNKDGLTDEEVSEIVDKLSPAEQKAQAIAIKKNIREYQQNKEIIAQQKADEQFTQIYTKVEEENQKLVNDYLSRIEGTTNIEGIEFGQSDMAQFKKDLPEMMKRKIVVQPDGSKIAISEAEELLQQLTSDNEKSMGLIPLLWMLKHNKFKGYTSSVKEQAKKRVEDKLDKFPPQEKGSGFGITNEIDDQALYAD